MNTKDGLFRVLATMSQTKKFVGKHTAQQQDKQIIMDTVSEW